MAAGGWLAVQCCALPPCGGPCHATQLQARRSVGLAKGSRWIKLLSPCQRPLLPPPSFPKPKPLPSCRGKARRPAAPRLSSHGLRSAAP
ncbi:hypothetical protein HaLaN_16034 [Haematococcus lacustris]|uniref:Uncharacterized protein n=1 Tax=Haematococcus lacustris TaxID=44745 RepID=A0A699Z923_HAELA|nr:hypothetical protein HaLaN_16034 [Haematococcus lacustris]